MNTVSNDSLLITLNYTSSKPFLVEKLGCRSSVEVQKETPRKDLVGHSPAMRQVFATYEPIGGNPGYSRNPAVVEVFRIEFLLHFWIALEKSSPPMLSET